MIDVYLPEAVSSERNAELLPRLTEALLRWTDATEIAIARANAGAYLHIVPRGNVTAGGVASTAVRIDVKLPEVVLSTIERRRGFIGDATAIVAALVPQPPGSPTWVTVSNTVDGGWGIDGHGMTNAELDEY